MPVLLSAGASLAGLDRLFDDGWLADAGPNRARFLQPAQVREVVAAIPWSRRRKWHSELARASEALRRPGSDVAHHHLEAHEFEAARPMLLRAAEKARQQRRFRQALTFIRQAVDIWPLNVEPETRLGSLQEMAPLRPSTAARLQLPAWRGRRFLKRLQTPAIGRSPSPARRTRSGGRMLRRCWSPSRNGCRACGKIACCVGGRQLLVGLRRLPRQLSPRGQGS